MKRKIILSVILITVLSVLYCGTVIRGAILMLQGAAITNVKGNPQLQLANGTRVTLGKNMKVSISNLVLPGTSLLTGSGSSVDIQFTDAIKMRIGPNSSLSLDIAQLVREKNFTRISLKLNKGNICGIVSKKLPADSNFLIKTGSAMMNIIGTEFMVNAETDSTKVLVKKGRVQMVDKSGSSEYVDKGNTGTSSNGKVMINESSGEEVALMDDMSDDIAEISEDMKKEINSILENNEYHRSLYNAAVDEQKKANHEMVDNQKNSDAKMVKDLKDSNRSLVDSLKQKNRESTAESK